MRFRLRSLLFLVALVAVVLAIFVHLRNQRRAAWVNLQAEGVHFIKSGSNACAEIWVSKIDHQTFDVNGERQSQQAARNKLIRIRQDASRLGITWLVAMDDFDFGLSPTHQTTLDLVESSGFTRDSHVGQGKTTTIDERREFLKSENQLYIPPVGPRKHDRDER